MRVVAALSGDEDHHLLGRARRALVKAGMSQLFQGFGVGDVITLPQLHVGACGREGRETNAVFHLFVVEGLAGIVDSDGPAVL